MMCKIISENTKRKKINDQFRYSVLFCFLILFGITSVKHYSHFCKTNVCLLKNCVYKTRNFGLTKT